ncbi:MAG: type I-C CRISPR-associated protein Cas8c/Csd1 [Candidatus Electrothrix sp. Rat3]|nr:type I-C CRISPR-associated protein Cas8c/Csd1 [Candidatus Electrothrix rattekaaiensis]
MSWLAQLHKTYEQGLTIDQSAAPFEKRLMPVSHTLQNAHINIVIDEQGNFKRAAVLEKTQIVLPATEKSAGRSSGEAPHPLADKIQYVAKDYAEYGGRKKPYFEGYEKQLANWCDSPCSHPKACAVHTYIKKGQVVADLIAHHILHVDEQGQLLETWSGDVTPENPEPLIFKVLPKTKGETEQGNALVCWSVEKEGDADSKTWTDQSLHQSWADFDGMAEGAKGLCFILGQEEKLTASHPAKLRHTGDKAKLISANDMAGFTFRGRFTDTKKSIEAGGSQAVGISLEVTQKAHNALRWLISRQGFRNGDQVYVSWAVSGKKIPEPLADTWSLLATSEITKQPEAEQEEEHQVDHTIDAGDNFAHKLSKYIAGYRQELEVNEQIVVMGLDSATPGRMGIIYYRELLASEFLDRLHDWHDQFAWPQRHTQELPDPNGRKKPGRKTIWPVSCPIPRVIAEAAYGDILKSNDTLKKSLLERILPCIVDGRSFPKDIMLSAVRRASNRNNCDHWEWERNLGVACALFKGYYERHTKTNKRRRYNMALEKDRTARDYLYGRLLAVAEKIEEVALNVGGEKRPTNAARLMQRFSDRPFSTWLTIEKNLQPYMQRLQGSRAGFLTNRKKELDEIHAAFVADDFTSDKSLTGEFLLGYHCQRMDLRKKSESEPSEKDKKND